MAGEVVPTAREGAENRWRYRAPAPDNRLS
jgi:hypothetical protein